MINNRQAGRRRGRGGNGGGGNGGPRQGNPGRPDNGNRIDNRARGNASQLLEKYKNMAADAQRAGDRVATEYYLQFADHYFRVLSEQRGRFEEQQPRRGRDDLDFDGDEEFGDEGEIVRTGEQGADGRFDRDDRQRDERPREDRPREDRPREDRSREDRPREDRPREDRQRDDRPRADRQRDEQPREDRQRDDRPRAEAQDRPRADRVREDRPRDDRQRDANGDGRGEARARGEWQEREPRRERRPEPAPVEIAGQRRAEPPMAGESLEQRAEEVLEADRPLETPAPRRRGRPRREAEPVVAEVAAEANGFEADRLPPALTIAANDEAPVEAKPRRRRARPVEDTPTAAE